MPSKTRIIVDTQSFSKPIEFSRKKQYPFSIRLSYRLYYFARIFLRKEKLLLVLLNTTWFLQRISQEQTYHAFKDFKQPIDILRPRNVNNILDSAINGQRVLDFGGGTGAITRALLKSGNKVVYLDHSEEASNSAKNQFGNNPDFTLLLPEELERQPNNSFDLIVLSHVLEHVEDRKELLSKLKSKARKIHIEVPDYASDPLNYVRSIFDLPVHKDDDHVVEFTLESLTELILDVELKIEKIEVRDGCIVAICICD